MQCNAVHGTVALTAHRWLAADACSLDLRGWVPQIVTDTIALPEQLGTVYILQVYFQQVRPLSECDAEDGRIVGYMLLDLVQGNRKDLAHAVRTFVNRAAMLRECGFCHIDAMLTCLLCATAQRGPADAPASIDPSSMTELQAAAIGRAIASSVHGSHAPIEALKKVVESHAVLGIMRSRFAWFSRCSRS